MKPGEFVGKFIPYPKQERVIKVPEIVYRIEEYKRLSKQAKLRLEWIKKYKEIKNASKVCRYFGISRKTFYKWKRRYELFGIRGLEDRNKAPKNKRQPEITREQEIRVIELRRKYIRYGPKKLAILYERCELQVKIDLFLQLNFDPPFNNIFLFSINS